MVSGEPLIGKQLANYRIEKLIGHGGMAKVYLGWDIRLHRSVAVKIIDDRFRNDPNYTERFLREARTMATWQHMNIPLVYHVGEDEGVLFFAMEYIHGQNLAQLLRQYTDHGELIPYPEVLRIGWAVAKALDYAHLKGVVHRDVTPSNVILSEDGRVVLMDFGLALDVIEGTQGGVFGTPHYIAPEQARSSALAVRQSDLYSLGVILYEMLTGIPPFDDPSPITLALKHITDDPPPPSKINPKIQPEVETVLLKAMRKKPSERFQSGQELMEALEGAYKKGTESQPVTLAELPEKPDNYPAPTLAEIPEVKVPDPLLAIEKISVDTQKLEGSTSGAARSRYLALGGVGCGLLILIGFVMIVGGISLALSRQNSPTKTTRIRSFSQVTPTPTRSHTTGSTLTPSATRIRPSPSATSSTTATPTPQITYELSLISYKSDSLFVLNQGTQQIPLASLEFKNRNGGISGEEWEVDFLEDGECVTLWKKEGRPKAPKGLKCDEVGARLERSGSKQFWAAQFEVYYHGEKIGTCETFKVACSIKFEEIKR